MSAARFCISASFSERPVALGHQFGIAVNALALLYQTDFAVVGLSFCQNLAMILLGSGIGWLAAFSSVSRKIATFKYWSSVINRFAATKPG